MKKTAKPLFAAILAISLILSACGGVPGQSVESGDPAASNAPAAPRETANPPQTPTKGGELKLSMRPPKTLNPLLNADKTVDAALRLVFEPLAMLDASRKPVPNPAVLSGWSFAADGLSATLTLREGAAWSDGKPITPADVRYTIEALRGADSLYSPCVANIALCEAAGGQTVKLTFAGPFGAQAYQLRFPIVPEHYYAKTADTAMRPVGNGLYAFESYNATDGMALAANPAACAGEPYISRVQVLLARTDEAELNLFDQNVTDALTAFVDDSAKYKASDRYRAETYTTGYYDFIGINSARDSWQTAAARRALASAVPLERIRQTAYIGGITPAPALTAPTDWLYEPNAAERAYDPASAASALRPLGAMTVLVNDENAERAKAAELLAESLAECGVELTVESLPFEAYKARLDEGDYDLFIGGYSLAPTPYYDFLLASSGNVLNYQNGAMDMLLAAMFKAPTDYALQSAASDVQRFITDEAPFIGIGFRQAAFAVSARVRGELRPTADAPLGNIGAWFVQEG